MSPAEIANEDGRARAHFTYTPDGAIDEWHSSADKALIGMPYADDCDGLASTAVDLCFRAGVPEERLYRLFVLAEGSGEGHMVGAILDDEDRFWVIGDTFGPAYRAERMRHHAMEFRCLSDTGWSVGAPWQLETKH